MFKIPADINNVKIPKSLGFEHQYYIEQSSDGWSDFKFKIQNYIEEI